MYQVYLFSAITLDLNSLLSIRKFSDKCTVYKLNLTLNILENRLGFNFIINNPSVTCITVLIKFNVVNVLATRFHTLIAPNLSKVGKLFPLS